MLAPLLLGVLFVGLNAAFACTCIPQHPQFHYCESDFVMEAQINCEKQESQLKVYSFTPDQVYKVTQLGTNLLHKGKLITQADSAACGTELLIGKKYLLTGRVLPNWLEISACNFLKTVDTLTDFEKDTFRHSFGQNCNCNVLTEGHIPYPTNTNSTCLWNTFSNTEDCQKKYAVCKDYGDSCDWEGNRMYKKCLKKHI